MSALFAAALCATVLVLETTSVQAQGNPLSRPLTLPHRTLRVDLVPADYGFMDHGELNSSRGFRLFDAGDEVGVAFGSGLAYGLARDWEIGALVLPLVLAPDSDVGDLEFYGRYSLGRELAFQATVQLPTATDVGLGFGVPVHIPFGHGDRLETGGELELVFAEDTRVNLDLPLAVNFAVTHAAFLGVRSGIFFDDLDDIAINLGATGGVGVTPDVDLTGSLNFPRFLWSGPGDAINADPWELIFGMAIHFST